MRRKKAFTFQMDESTFPSGALAVQLLAFRSH